MSKLSDSRFLPVVLAALLWLPGWSAAAVTGEQPAAQSSDMLSAASPWPARFVAEGTTFVVYPPQFDQWQDDRLQGRAAVSVQTADAAQPRFGVIWLSARTDTAGGMVSVHGLIVDRADFPTAADRAGAYTATLTQQLAAKTWRVAQSQLQNDMAIDRAARQTARAPLNNAPPRIVYTQQPAILIPVDGKAVLRDVEGTSLLRVVNTRALILLDKQGGHYYLYVAGHWMGAQTLDGPWSPVAAATAELERAKQLAVQQGQADLLDEDKGQANNETPTVYVSTQPSELVQTDGPPVYSPIGGTQLLYVTNTPNQIFFDLNSQRYYLLISGRWYRAPDLGRGPWEYVAANNLPRDFALIPPDHPTAAVRASVPGTPDAEEAVIANSVPQIATVQRDAAHLEVNYDGQPSFRPIEGTPLQYAVNSPIPVIRVRADSFYALDNGVWFNARSPYGPWSVASHVPSVIYTIPSSSPLYYVTSVRIYNDTADSVDVGYTPGYVGSYVSSDDVVVYGTGWAYPAWVGTYWYGPPLTWGWGFSFVSTWWNPWWPAWGVAWAPYPCFHPWWGPWLAFGPHPIFFGGRRTVINNVTVNNTINVGNIYQRWGHKAVTAKSFITPHAPGPIQGKSAFPPKFANAAPGTGHIAGSDGHWQHYSWRNDAPIGQPRNEGGGAAKAPPIQVARAHPERWTLQSGMPAQPSGSATPQWRASPNARPAWQRLPQNDRWPQGTPENRWFNRPPPDPRFTPGAPAQRLSPESRSPGMPQERQAMRAPQWNGMRDMPHPEASRGFFSQPHEMRGLGAMQGGHFGGFSGSRGGGWHGGGRGGFARGGGGSHR